MVALLTEVIFRGGCTYVTALSGDYTLTADEVRTSRIFRFADGAGNVVKLPPLSKIEAGGPVFYIFHESGGSTLEIQDSDSTTLLANLAPGGIAIVLKATSWVIETATENTGRTPNTRVQTITAAAAAVTPSPDCSRMGNIGGGDCSDECPETMSEAEYEALPASFFVDTTTDGVQAIADDLCTDSDANDAAWDGFFVQTAYATASADPYKVYELSPIPSGKTGLSLNSKKLDETNTGIYWIPPEFRIERQACWRREFHCEGAGLVHTDYANSACADEWWVEGGPDDGPCDPPSDCDQTPNPSGYWVQTRYCESDALTGSWIPLEDADQFSPVFALSALGNQVCHYIDWSTITNSTPIGTILVPPPQLIYPTCEECNVYDCCCPCDSSYWTALLTGGVPSNSWCALLKLQYRLADYQPGDYGYSSDTSSGEICTAFEPADGDALKDKVWAGSFYAEFGSPCKWSVPYTSYSGPAVSHVGSPPTYGMLHHKSTTAYAYADKDFNAELFGAFLWLTTDLPSYLDCTWIINVQGVDGNPYHAGQIRGAKQHGLSPLGRYVDYNFPAGGEIGCHKTLTDGWEIT